MGYVNLNQQSDHCWGGNLSIVTYFFRKKKSQLIYKSKQIYDMPVTSKKVKRSGVFMNPTPVTISENSTFK